VITSSEIAPTARSGFGVPVHDAQRTFRAVMSALSEPGTVHTIDSGTAHCAGLSAAMTAIALTLADYETRVWLGEGAAQQSASFLSFYAGAPIVATPNGAAFAFVTQPLVMPRLTAFARGSLDYPDASTTVIIDVDTINTGSGWALVGPGITGQRRLAISGLPETFGADLDTNRAAFPCGVDIIFCVGTRIAALPRSTRRVRSTEGR
jgi:alpha-D-ribose 1-methylphosphonate 5-triphosphate synthase subunit PhnH